MSILSSIGRIATEFSAARTRYQTERAIRALPIELQKDIGWPEATNDNTAGSPIPVVRLLRSMPGRS